ncbi:coiled-coil domain-containing protein 17 [Coturnix japonica]|uniref:coiled-coil domain-containing protein 17 n=1 Tax=Coturnix japonica TaxID=93934 RepID=UPI000777A941|nr:coiled-coil domain-containing protein 17 [Coturnix japonica]XP_032302279.1 coiled-coil domain-containing protein 17 [Coturnix japonica]XP_032302280.1 coiled-coil domain-containing protein 17 [Coturnix japonica]
MAAAGAFACPRCRLAFGSLALLRAHRERFCIGAPAGGGTGEEPGRAAGRRERAVTMSQHEDQPKRRHVLLLSGLPRSPLGREGPGRARGAPLGDILTPRERALLRAPAVSRPAQRGEPSPPRGDPRVPELLEAHQRHVAEIRARTQQLEQQREQLSRRLALLCNKQLSPEMNRVTEVPSDRAGHQHQGAAVYLDTLLPPSGPLAAEARALRLSYLRAGGHDEATLAQLLDLQLEATALEKRAAQKMSKNQPQHRAQGQDPIAVEAARGLDAALMAVEMENQRLEGELLALKVRREMRADVGSLASQQRAEELAQLQAKMEILLRRQAEGMGPRLPPAVLPPPVAPPLSPAFALADPLRPTPRTGSPTASSRPLVPSSLPSIPFGALDDPPPT